MYFANLAVSGLVQGLLLAMIALSVALCFSVSRFANAATGDLMTVSAYVAVLTQHLFNGSLTLSLIASLVVTIALSLGCYALLFRHFGVGSSVMALISSVGLGLFLRSLILLFAGPDQQSIDVPIMRAINLGGVRIVPIDILIAVASLVTLGVIFFILYRTGIGLRVRAIADNRDLARSSGIKSRRVLVTLWVLCGAVLGVGGFLVGVKTVVTPDMGWNFLLPGFAAAILGGMGNPLGAVIAAVLMGIFQELSTPFVGFVYKSALAFSLLIGILIWKPEGLFGRPEQVR